MLTWLAQNCLTPINPVMTGSDLGTILQKIISLSGVTSVNGQTGTISLTSDDIGEGSTNKYFTDARVANYGDAHYAQLANPLSQFAATTSAQLASVISDETGTGSVVFNNSPTLVTPTLGVATATTLSLTGTVGGPAPTSGIRLGTATTGNSRLGMMGTTGLQAVFNWEGLTVDRVYTLPDVGGTVALINGSQTFTNTVWNAAKIAELYGGTNQSSYTTGDMLYASAANTLSKLTVGANNTVLTVIGGVPTWASVPTSTSYVDLTTDQSIDGSKLFSDLQVISAITFDNGIGNKSIIYGQQNIVGTATFQLPSSSGHLTTTTSTITDTGLTKWTGGDNQLGVATPGVDYITPQNLSDFTGFIRNQNATVQSANFWMNGTGYFGPNRETFIGNGYAIIANSAGASTAIYPTSVTVRTTSDNQLAIMQASPGSTSVLLSDTSINRGMVIYPDRFDFGDGYHLVVNSTQRTANRTQTFQNADGVIALTTDATGYIVNATTTALSSATLNSTYPTAPIGYRVICGAISGGGVIYTKYATNTWLATNAPVQP